MRDDPRHLNLLHLVVANVGRGPARNVALEFEADAAEFAAKGLRHPVGKRLPTHGYEATCEAAMTLSWWGLVAGI